MLIAAVVSRVFKDGSTLNILFAGITTLIVGVTAMFFTREHEKEIRKRDGYLVVAIGWVVMALSGTLPYVFSNTIPSFTNAFFETMSGYTTTGASILNDIESMPEGILFWRSLTHWIGGMGII
ncbi:MAG: TrkH family potassium uptake protein, partial [Bacteroidia bacterium]|nr:TrkH family potassium uptake protein [Bacteroidia bacterium]